MSTKTETETEIENENENEFGSSSSSSSSDEFSNEQIKNQNVDSNINDEKNEFEFNKEANPLLPRLEEEKPLSIGELKIKYMRSHMLSKKLEYCKLVCSFLLYISIPLQPRNCRTVCVTWNVNGREPQENLSTLLPNGPTAPDILVVGLQEVDRRAEAYMYNVSAREQVWVDAIRQALEEKYPDEPFVKVASKTLVGLHIVVYVSQLHSGQIGKISLSSASCGLMGIIGNKGAVGIRFKIYNDYVCFVNCHLAAHPNQVFRRNQDLADLHKRLIFPVNKSKSSKSTSSKSTSSSSASSSRNHRHESFTDTYWNLSKRGSAGVEDCDVLIWLGDFNYRVEMESELARVFVNHGQYSPVLKNDQMTLQRESGQEHLIRYMEAEINFAPSYSFDTGTDVYDSSEKQRVPSWCDRIIWRLGDRVEEVYYDCLFEFKSSDHKPVRLGNVLEVNELVPELFDACYFETLKQLDAFENAVIPDTEVNRNIIDAGVISYHHVAQETFKIMNKGKVMAPFRFIVQDQELENNNNENNKSNHLPSWIRVEPLQGLIGPGEFEEIRLTFLYNNFVAINSNLKKKKKKEVSMMNSNLKYSNDDDLMEHILILHIEGGRDHFVSVSFKCRETDFGSNLEDLKFHRVILNRNEPNLLFKVPTVLWRLVDILVDQGGALQTRNLFLLSGTNKFNDLIQNSLDLHEPFPEEINCEVGYHSVAESILRFFDAFPDSLIPSIFFERFLNEAKNAKNTNTNTAILQMLNEIPEPNFFVFEYFLRFIRDILIPANPETSKISISKVMARALIRRNYYDSELDQEYKKNFNDISVIFLNLLNHENK